MKFVITILFTCFNLVSFCQTGKVKIEITITDTIKPYFLDIYTLKESDLISKITVATSGSYFINDLKEGKYSIELHSFESNARRIYIDSVNIIRDSITNLKIIYPGPCKFVYAKGYKPLCPYNHFDKIVKIVYGLPNDKTMAKAKKGLIYLGGCIISDCDPKYYCTIHKREI